jgi:H+-translocating NAD(P) transhydrogenase subunit beta
LIGAISFSGSMIAFAKLQGWMNKTYQVPLHHIVSLGTLAVAVICGIAIIANPQISGLVLFLFFALALIFGVLMTVPIGGADMPVVISLYNALTGLAVGFEGFVLNNAAMIIAGTVVGAAGTLLTQLMAKAMNRPILKLLTPAPVTASTTEVQGTQKAIEAQDAAIQMAYAAKVIIVPGYGMAVAQAQHKVWELTQLLEDKGIEVKFAIHPVAGRMPGHMNVLLAEAGVPYDKIFDLEEVNPEFPNTDVALIIGANDVVNPVARTDKGSPIYGMPILNVDYAHNVIVIKRGKGAGFSGVENALFYMDNTRMFYGSGQEAVNQLIQQLKQL